MEINSEDKIDEQIDYNFQQSWPPIKNTQFQYLPDDRRQQVGRCR